VLRKTAIALAVAATAAGLTALPAHAAKPVVTGHEALTHGMMVRDVHAAKGNARPTRSSNLTYHGGVVQTTPEVVIVYWGSQWGSLGTDGFPTSDGAHLASVQKAFFSSVGDHQWVNSTRQYCAATSCTSAQYAKWAITDLVGNRTWLDGDTAAPSRPTQSQLAAEAVKAANYVKNTLGLTPTKYQYIIDTASGNNASGFGTQYCAWHISTSYGSGQIAYTNMPYVPDAGSSCGAGFVKTGTANVDSATQGVTIVGGHEWAETITDEFPNGGWLDSSGAENGDKCAWLSSGTGASHVITTSAGDFAVQTLWSNANNGCI